MELATKGHRVRRGHGYNLPVDPRPTLNAIVADVRKALRQTGLTTAVVAKPTAYGIGEAFRTDTWFNTVPQYQHPGTSPLAPKSGRTTHPSVPRTPQTR